jgi:hypothetical protein
VPHRMLARNWGFHKPLNFLQTRLGHDLEIYKDSFDQPPVTLSCLLDKIDCRWSENMSHLEFVQNHFVDNNSGVDRNLRADLQKEPCNCSMLLFVE